MSRDPPAFPPATGSIFDVGSANHLFADARMQTMLARLQHTVDRFVHGLARGHRQTTENVVQETMGRAWRNLDTFPVDE